MCEGVDVTKMEYIIGNYWKYRQREYQCQVNVEEMIQRNYSSCQIRIYDKLINMFCASFP